MTQIEKLLQKLLSRPTTLRYSQIRKLLIHLDFEEVPAEGSHRKFKHPLLEKDIIVPVHNNDCKEVYKKQVAKTIKENELHR